MKLAASRVTSSCLPGGPGGSSMRWRGSRVAAIRSAVEVSRATGARPVRETAWPSSPASSTPAPPTAARSTAACRTPFSTGSARSATWSARPSPNGVVSIRSGCPKRLTLL